MRPAQWALLREGCSFDVRGIANGLAPSQILVKRPKHGLGGYGDEWICDIIYAMATLAFLLILPLLLPILAKRYYGHEITWLEMGLNMFIAAAIVSGGWFLGRYAEMADVQFVNGEVTRKYSKNVPCEHSYKCRCTETCTTRSDGSKSCSETCDTCYDHSHDVDWLVEGNVGSVKIDRVDRQGVNDPAWWTRAIIGEPMAIRERYINYVKGAKQSLFKTVAEVTLAKEYQSLIPNYPENIVDYYRLDRFVPVGVPVPNAAQWNAGISNRLKSLGPTKQVNLVVVTSAQAQRGYGTALRSHWLNGKKNDVVVVLGAPAYPAVAWADVIAWTDNEHFKVSLRDKLQDLGDMSNPEAVLDIVQESIVRDYVRKPMQDYEYLASEIEPPMWVIVLLALGGIGASWGVAVVLSRNQMREGNGRFGRY